MKKILAAFVVLLPFQGVYAQQADKLVFDEYVLKKVGTSISANGGITDPEMLYNEISANKILKDWIVSHTIKSLNLINATVSIKKNQVKFVASAGAEEQTRHVFFDQDFFDSVPKPDLSSDEVSNGYKESNSSFFSDKKVLENNAKETLQAQGANDLFTRGIIPLEGDGLTQKMFLVRSSKDGNMVSVIEELGYRMRTGNKTEIPHAKINYRPLRSKALLLEKKYWYSDDEISYIKTALENEARFFEESIAAWSPKTNYYAITAQEKNSDEANALLPYTVSRAILLRMCQERMVFLENKFWLEKLTGLANLNAETITVFSSVSWGSAEAQKGDLNNPVIQLAQRASTINLRLDKILFEASLLESKSKLVFRNYERAFTDLQ